MTKKKPEKTLEEEVIELRDEVAITEQLLKEKKHALCELQLKLYKTTGKRPESAFDDLDEGEEP